MQSNELGGHYFSICASNNSVYVYKIDFIDQLEIKLVNIFTDLGNTSSSPLCSLMQL